MKTGFEKARHPALHFFRCQITPIMPKYKYKRENLYTVIVFYQDGQTLKAAKYHKIQCDKPGSWKATIAFFKQKFPTAEYCNIYGGVSGDYRRREYFNFKP